MRVDFNLNSPEEVSIGIFQSDGQDEHGEFHQLSIELIFISIDFVFY